MILVGIAGLSGSGKTLLARRLSESSCDTGVLCTDSYYRDLAGVSASERETVNFDAPAALDWDLLLAHLRQLSAGRRVAVPQYDFQSHTRLPDAAWMEPRPTVVLEGLFALSDLRVRLMADLTIFLDAPEEVCLARRIARDTATRGRTEASVRLQWHRDVIPMFRKHVLPARASAGLLVDGQCPPEASARAVLAQLRLLQHRLQ